MNHPKSSSRFGSERVRARRSLAVIVAILAAVGIAGSVSHFFREDDNPAYARFAPVVWLHVVLGAVYLALAPFQFIGSIRARARGYHRRAGRVVATIGTVIGAAALIMSVAIPIAGWWERVVVGSFAVYFLFALGRAVYCIRHQQVAQHREWMIRAFAIALSIATMRVFGLAIAVFTDNRSLEFLRFVFNLCLTVALVLHVAIAEAWIHATRPDMVQEPVSVSPARSATG
jgi:uncharacterized membrane protein